MVSEVFSVRIPRELKRMMKELEDIVNWREEITRFLWERVRYYQKVKAVKKAREVIEKHPKLQAGTSARSVRWDRDSR